MQSSQYYSTMALGISALVLFVLTVHTDGASLPNYLKACSKSDPNLAECARKHGNEALPYIVQGDKEFKIPPMNPLKIPELRLDPGPDLKILLKDCEIYGLETAQITNVEIDLTKRHASVTMAIPRLNLLGDYDINGKILILPIQGHGPANLTLVGGEYTYTFDWDLVVKNGKEYAKIVTSKVGYTTRRDYYDFGNLFNGDKLLGDQTNRFLNDNWKDVEKDVGPAVQAAILSICNRIASGYYNRIPYEYIFLQ